MKTPKSPLDVASQFEELRQENVVRRLWDKDPSLWKSDPSVHQSIRNRLGWLDLPSFMSDAQPDLNDFVKESLKAGFKDLVLLGMGGSSLCPEVLRVTFGTKPGFLRLHVLDTTDPGAIASVAKKIRPKTTLFLVSSKSGGTIEVVSLFKYFWGAVERAGVKNPGSHFVAITDPDTSLGALAKKHRFRRTFLSRSDVGGRFSALTYFGLVPAALTGMDIQKMLDRSLHMADICGSDVPAEDNPGVQLGAWLSAGKEVGRDKMTLVTSRELSGFGLWVEQLVAESTGKDGTGILPVESEGLEAPARYAHDRLFVYVRLKKSKEAALENKLAALEKAGHPVFRITLNDAYDLAGEFFRWEFATAVAGQILGVNPFDEPNVSESKANTLKVLSRFEAKGALPETPPDLQENQIKAWRLPPGKTPTGLGSLLKTFLLTRKGGDYLAIMAYVTPSAAHHTALQQFRKKLGDATGLATTLGYGPRFLHSTGQLHKGGGNNGLFIQITADDGIDLEVPGSPYGFSVLKRSQALGDIQALKDHRRRTVRFHLTEAFVSDLKRLTAIVKK